MTSAQDSTTVSNVQTQLVFVVAPVNHTAVAQLLGDEAYEAVLALIFDGPAAADAYHVAVQRYARQHPGAGAAPWCNCNTCCTEFGEVAK